MIPNANIEGFSLDFTSEVSSQYNKSQTLPLD